MSFESDTWNSLEPIIDDAVEKAYSTDALKLALFNYWHTDDYAAYHEAIREFGDVLISTVSLIEREVKGAHLETLL